MNINGIEFTSESILYGCIIHSQTTQLVKKIFEYANLQCNFLTSNLAALGVTIRVYSMKSTQIQLGILIILFISNLFFDIIEGSVYRSQPSFLTHYIGTNKLINKHDNILKAMRIHFNQKSIGHIILCGEPGCGKTAIMQLFANKVATNEYLEFRKAEIYKLDATSLACDTALLGQLDAKINHFKRFIQFRKKAGIKKIIIVIDEIHNLCGMGASTKDKNDVWQMIKEELAEEPSPFIILGATTEKEYDEHIANDPALASRLAKVRVSSLSDDDTKKILECKANDLNKEYELNLSNEDHNKLLEEASTRTSSTNLRDRVASVYYVYAKYDLETNYNTT